MSMPPQKSELPRFVDARRMVQRQQRLTGTVAQASLIRLASAVESILEDISVELSFAQDFERNPVVSGRLQFRVQRICQRCLQALSQQLQAEFNWGIVGTEERGHELPRSLDPVVQDGDELDLYQALEDEMLLNLPAVAYHDEDCVDRTRFSSGTPETGAAEPSENPFKVLEQLKISPNRR